MTGIEHSEMHSSSERNPSIFTQEHSQLETYGNIGRVKQELSDMKCEDGDQRHSKQDKHFLAVCEFWPSLYSVVCHCFLNDWYSYQCMETNAKWLAFKSPAAVI